MHSSGTQLLGSACARTSRKSKMLPGLGCFVVSGSRLNAQFRDTVVGLGLCTDESQK